MDINKVILMCIMHDFGEAFTGDIPAFSDATRNLKKRANEDSLAKMKKDR